MHPKFIVREIEPGRWALDYMTDVGTATGYTTFPNSEVAITLAKERDADVEIEVRPLAN